MAVLPWEVGVLTTHVTVVNGVVSTPQALAPSMSMRVDATGHLVTSVSDGISLYTGGADPDPDAGDFTGAAHTMVNGIATFPPSDGIGWGNAGLTGPVLQTIQVIDYTLQPACQIEGDMVGAFDLTN